jgi:protein-S-isoprenylcysteine O-methyltransferase Ste14
MLPIGILLLILSIYTAGTGLAIVFGKDAQNRVVRKGVFRFVRHPIYLGEIILYFSFLLMNLSLAAAGVWIVGTIFLHRISCNEEKQLKETYGREYEEYMQEVPMWFPRLIR